MCVCVCAHISAHESQCIQNVVEKFPMHHYMFGLMTYQSLMLSIISTNPDLSLTHTLCRTWSFSLQSAMSSRQNAFPIISRVQRVVQPTPGTDPRQYVQTVLGRQPKESTSSFLENDCGSDACAETKCFTDLPKPESKHVSDACSSSM